MKIIDYLKDFKKELENSESLHMSLANVHCKGLFSLVISGTEHGKLKRVFVASKKIKKGQVQFHSHRYPIKLTVLGGEVVNHEATKVSYWRMGVRADSFAYSSPLNGGSGLRYIETSNYLLIENAVPKGMQISMGENEIHTISCSKGSIWVVEELGFKVDESIVLGVPFTTSGLYNKPEQFQINHNYELVMSALNEIITTYSQVGGL